MSPGERFRMRSAEPPDWMVKCTLMNSFPSATTLSWVDVPSVQKALAPVMWRTMPVTFPEGTFVAPRRMELPWSLVRFTLSPTLVDTL